MYGSAAQLLQPAPIGTPAPTLPPEAPEYIRSVRRSIAHVVLWSLATILGYVFAGLATHFPGSFPVGSGVVTTFNSGAALFGLVIGTVGGLAIGTLQWLVLRSWLGITWPWLAATAVAVGLTHALGDGLPSSFEWSPLAVAGGLVMSISSGSPCAVERTARRSRSQAESFSHLR